MTAPSRPYQGQQLVIAAAESSELPTFANLWARADAARRGVPVPPRAPVDVVDELRRELGQDPRAWALLARERGVAVGAVRLTDARQDRGCGPPIPLRAHLASLAVEPTRWGQGIGAALLRGAEGSAKRRGYVTIQLVVHSTNARARTLYRQAGWVETEDHLLVDGAWLTHFEKQLA